MFQLPEQYLAPLQRKHNQGEPAAKLSVRFSNRDEWYNATLKELSTVADSSTASYSVVATLNRPKELNALTGMAAEVRINLPASGKDKKSIPRGAILTEGENQYLFRWLKEKNIVEKIAVEMEDGMIKSGLNDGDWIAVAGVHELTNGQSVVQWVKERGL